MVTAGEDLELKCGPAAERNCINEFVLARDRELGSRYGLEYAEQCPYIGPGSARMEEYIRQNAQPLR